MPSAARSTSAALAQVRAELQQARSRIAFSIAAQRSHAAQLEALLDRLDEMDWALFRAEAGGGTHPPTRH